MTLAKAAHVYFGKKLALLSEDELRELGKLVSGSGGEQAGSCGGDAMTFEVQFVGIVRTGGVNSRILVQAGDGLYYVWKGSNEAVRRIQSEGHFACTFGDLELASEIQVSVGRGNRGTVDAGSMGVKYRGLVRRGKMHFRVLVSDMVSGEYFTVIIPVGDLPELGSVISVDRRCMFEAREDQIAAGLGTGKLCRKPRHGGKA
jgi:hypothetical protein